jgi:predicted ATPase/DNA-binding SARP family transcriptional activator
MLSIRTFGGLAIWLDEMAQPAGDRSGGGAAVQIVKFETRTVDALLVYLACQGRPIARDFVAELLWPERTQKQARTNLSVAIHRLRLQLAPYLLVTRQSIAINHEAGISLDVAHFEAHLARGQLAEATALYSGDFLDGFYRDGSPAFEQWALLERERLRILAIAAHQHLIGQTATAGRFDAAIANAQRLLHLDPLHEPTHRQLMRLLAQVDQRSAALAQYETCRQLLAVELDASPDETTTALYQQIRFGEPSSIAGLLDEQMNPATPYSGIASSVILSSINNLPPQPTPFIGRDAELAQVENLLSNLDCRLLTLIGVGGIGKTRLALESATRQASSFAEGVCFVTLAPIATAELGVMAIAQSLGLQITSSDPKAEIAAYLYPRELLLILDNFEHLLDAADTVAQLLQNAPRLKVLVTSRARLYLREEWLLPIAGLSLAEGLVGEAGQLFVRSAQRVHPGFTGQGEEEAIAAICRQVEGMPLALELAASWVRVMPCADIARQMQANLDFLTSGVRNLPERHRSIRAVIDGSWRLLSPVEQGVLRRVSVFQGGWALDEAAEVAGATRTLLLSLVDKSLVGMSAQHRFELHELVRQYAAEQLTASGEGELMCERHYATYLQFFRRADGHLRRLEMATWLARLRHDQDNLRAALQWALDEARYVDAAWLMLAVSYFWNVCGFGYEEARWLAQLLPHRQVLTTDLRLAILLTFYRSAFALEEFQPIDRYMREVMGLLESCAYRFLHATAWCFLAWTTSDIAQAAANSERGIALARAACESPGIDAEFGAIGDRDFVLASHLWGYAAFLIDQGELARAAPIAAESLQLFRAQGNHTGIGESLGTLGRVALLQGDLTQAHKLFQQAVTFATTLNYTAMQSEWQALLAITTLFGGDASEARLLLTESLRRCLDQRNTILLAQICTCLAEVALWEGKVGEAEQWLAQSLTYHTHPRRITILHVERLFVAARLATAQEEYRRAATLFGMAEQMHSHIRYAYGGPVRDLVDKALATVREALGVEAFDEAFTAGQHLSLSEAYGTILAPAYLARTN